MKKIRTVLAICVCALLMSAGAYAKELEIETFLEPLEKHQIKTTESSIILKEPDLRAVQVSEVWFGDRELAVRLHYTVQQTEDGLTVKLRDSFLRRQEHGRYDVRIVMVKNSAETTFQVGESNSDVTETPPVTRW